MEQISFKDKKAIFSRLEKVASQANLTPEERLRYEEEWKIYNDYFNTIESAEKKAAAEAAAEAREKALVEGRAEGLAEGRMEERIANARNFKSLGVSTEIIMKATGLSADEIEKL